MSTQDQIDDDRDDRRPATTRSRTPRTSARRSRRGRAASSRSRKGTSSTGRVLKILEKEVVVDIGFKSEGVIDIDEVKGYDGQLTVKVGDRIEVLLERTENNDGYVVLSKEKAEKMKVWDEVERAFETGEPVLGRVIDRIKGGLKVDIGVPAFLPGSLVDVRPVRNLDALRGQEFRMRVIKVNKRRGNIVLSRKAVLEEENAEKKKKTLDRSRGGQDPPRHGEEPHRVRRVHRPRRHRRPAPHHRHGVGPHQPPLREVPDRRRGRRRRAQVRPRARARLARLQAAPGRSVGDRDRRSTRRRRASAARSSASPTTAPSSRSRRASRA